jgi:hypothetical protein
MPILHFEGHSDDTFGETNHFRDDYDNCASGKPIEFVLQHGDDGIVVVGQHCPMNAGSWLIGVSPYDPEGNDKQIPAWPIWFERSDDGMPSPRLVIDAPQGVIIRCLNRRE